MRVARAFARQIRVWLGRHQITLWAASTRTRSLLESLSVVDRKVETPVRGIRQAGVVPKHFDLHLRSRNPGATENDIHARVPRRTTLKVQQRRGTVPDGIPNQSYASKRYKEIWAAVYPTRL